MTKICFICSAARSGSTLLDLLIGGHFAAASLGEFSFLGKALALNQPCSCGEAICECSQWKKVLNHVADDRGIDLRQDPYRLRQWDTRASVVIDHKDQTPVSLLFGKIRSAWCDQYFGRRLDRSLPGLLPKRLRDGVANSFYLYGVIASEWGKQVIVDSSKNVHKALALYSRYPESVRIIYLTRDGRGVYFSRRSSDFSRAESIDGWYKYNARASRLLQSCVAEEHLYRLKYEDLVTRTPEMLEQICRFLGVEFDARMTDLLHGERHLVNGNQTMFKRDRGVKLDERWKSGLSGEELQYFNQRCGALNTALGYR